jgi:hypothetical protein
MLMYFFRIAIPLTKLMLCLLSPVEGLIHVLVMMNLQNTILKVVTPSSPIGIHSTCCLLLAGFLFRSSKLKETMIFSETLMDFYQTIRRYIK